MTARAALLLAGACGGAPPPAAPPVIGNVAEQHAPVTTTIDVGALVGAWRVDDEAGYWARFTFTADGRFAWAQGHGVGAEARVDDCADEGAFVVAPDADHPLGVLRLYPVEGACADPVGPTPRAPAPTRAPDPDAQVWTWFVASVDDAAVLLVDDTDQRLALRR